MTPEQRERRRKARERLKKKQKVLFQFRKPKRKKSRKSRRKPAAIRKRQYKPLASEIYNLPGALIDLIVAGRIDLRHPAGLAKAHKVADAVAAKYIPRDLMTEEERRVMHESIDRLSDHPLSIPEQLESLRLEREGRASELHSRWTANHERKANCYFQPPLVYQPQAEPEGSRLQAREVFE